jgi:hypothetical protein
MPSRLVLASAALGLTSLVAACGSSSSTSTPATPSPTSTPTISVTVPASSEPTVPAGAESPSGPEVNPAGDIPDNQVFVSYSPPGGAFSVKVPEGWARTEAGGAVSFTDKLNTIRMETAAMAAAPTPASVTSTELPAIEKTASNFKAGSVTTVSRTAGDAVLATYQADSPPNAVTGKVIPLGIERYEFWRNGTSVVLTLSGPVGADNVDPWKIVTDSFVWTS